MRNFGLWLFILSLPLLAALGHDGYMAYNNPQALDMSKPLPFSDAGWIWQRRAYDSWRWAHDTIDPKVWRRVVEPVLNQKAIVVAAALPVAFLAVALLLRLLGLGPYAGRGILVGRSPGRARWQDEGQGPGSKVRYKRR